MLWLFSQVLVIIEKWLLLSLTFAMGYVVNSEHTSLWSFNGLWSFVVRNLWLKCCFWLKFCFKVPRLHATFFICHFLCGRRGCDWCSRRYLGAEGHGGGADEERSQFDIDRAEDLGQVLTLYNTRVGNKTTTGLKVLSKKERNST